jgi:mannitol-1-/sugar-/sorbitol-6-phosphatase
MKYSYRVLCNAILFDLDGVLVDSMAYIECGLRNWAISHKLNPDHVVELSHGRRDLDVVRLCAPFLSAERETRLIQEQELAQAPMTRAMPGAVEIVDRLRYGSWAVVTSGCRAVATARLSAAGIREPKVLISSEDVTMGKPDPEGYLRAARELDVDPSECVVFEDALSGMKAARAAGMRVVGVFERGPTKSDHCDIATRGLSAIAWVRAAAAQIELKMETISGAAGGS